MSDDQAQKLIDNADFSHLGAERETEVKAALGSRLASIRERRAKAKAELFLDLPVPRYDPPVFVRFRPLEQTRIAAGMKEIEKAKDPDATARVHAGFLANACVGLFENVNGTPTSIDPDDPSVDPEDWPTFSPRLAELIEEPGLTRAVDVVRAFYLTDGDILATAGKLAEWSGYSGELLDQDFEGN